MFGRQNQEERFRKQEMAFQKGLTREQNASQMVDPNDAPYLYQKEVMQDLTRWQQDLDSDVERLSYDFKNMYEDENGKWVQTKQTIYEKDKDGILKPKTVYSKPMMNDHGIYRVISLTKRYLTRNLMMSNLSEEIICRIMKGIVIDLVIHISFNWQRYEMDFSDLSIVVRMIKDSIEPTLYRCWNDGERKYLNTINKRIETMNMSAEEQKKGVLAGVFGGK